MQILVIQGDLTQSQVDAIVNAANPTLMGGGGVDGAIHQAAGPELAAACAKLHGCLPGQAKTTPGFAFPAKWIIHTPGSIWQGGNHHEAQILKSSYLNALQEAERHHCQTVDFPSISTGVYHFPLKAAAKIAITTMNDFKKQAQYLQRVRLVAFDSTTKVAYQAVLAALPGLL